MDSNNIGSLVRVVHKEFEKLHREKALSMGLTSPQLFALNYLLKHQDQEICQRDIEHNFDLSHATVSGLISRLVNKGFVECEISAVDKRYKRIIITEKAKQCDTEMRLYIQNYEDQLTKGFSEDEKKLLRNFLLRMLENMNEDILKETMKENDI